MALNHNKYCKTQQNTPKSTGKTEKAYVVKVRPSFVGVWICQNGYHMVLIQLVLICLENLQIAAAAHFLMQDYFEALIPEPQHYCKHLSEKTSANQFKKVL